MPGHALGREIKQWLGLSHRSCPWKRWGRVETPRTTHVEGLRKQRWTRVRFPPPPPVRRGRTAIRGAPLLCAQAVRTRHWAGGCTARREVQDGSRDRNDVHRSRPPVALGTGRRDMGTHRRPGERRDRRAVPVRRRRGDRRFASPDPCCWPTSATGPAAPVERRPISRPYGSACSSHAVSTSGRSRPRSGTAMPWARPRPQFGGRRRRLRRTVSASAGVRFRLPVPVPVPPIRATAAAFVRRPGCAPRRDSGRSTPRRACGSRRTRSARSASGPAARPAHRRPTPAGPGRGRTPANTGPRPRQRRAAARRAHPGEPQPARWSGWRRDRQRLRSTAATTFPSTLTA